MTDSVSERFSSALSGSYELHRELGGGGMSRVFLATDRELGRKVVVKTLPLDTMSLDATERFKREIRLAASLQHPNIVPLLSAGEADGVPYYTMPWVDGASLRDRLKRGAVPVPEAIVILRDMARALAAAHQKSIVHRDIKPENVLLTSGAALITDFGVARALFAATHAGGGPSFQTGTGIAVGTPAYMAPEQFAADPSVDHRADVYAWGVVAYELLTGHHPFEGTHGIGLLQAHLSSEPQSIATRVPGVPAAVAHIVQRALAKDPALRPARAEELVDALDLSGAGSAARPRQRWPLAAAALLVLAAVAAVLASRRSNVAGDDRMIAIAPFRVGGAAPAVHYLREGLGDLMTPQLHSIPGVKAPSMRVMLEQWRRAGGSRDNDLPDDRALRVAAATGAGQLILGEIVGTAGRVTVTAQLMRVSDGAVLAPAKVEGPADSAAMLASRLVATLLSVRDGATVDRVRAVMSADPEAITAFLAGEQSYRRGRYEEAGKSYKRAFDHDSTFALAALRIYLTNGWGPTYAVPGNWLLRAWSHRDRLRGSDSLLLVAMAGPAFPAPTPARQYGAQLWEAAERANTAELWFQAGDVFTHRYNITGELATPQRLLSAFQRAEALDSSFAPALEHQASLLATIGRRAEAVAAQSRQRMLDSTGDFFLMIAPIIAAAVGTDEEAIAAFDHYLRNTTQPGGFVMSALSSDIDFGVPDDRRMPLAEAFLAQLPPERWPRAPASIVGYTLDSRSFAYNTGRLRLLPRAAGSDTTLGIAAVDLLAGLVWDGDSATTARAVRTLDQWSRASRDSSVLASMGRLVVGLWALEHGDTARVERERIALRAFPIPRESPWDSVPSRIHEKLLAAHLAVARKAPDARRRLEELDSLLVDSPVDRNMVLSIGNLLVSQLWERYGDDLRAYQAVNRQHQNLGLNAFGSTRLRLRARLAERLGRRQDAVKALRTFVAVRAKADPPFQREVATARATLARLTSTISRSQ